MRRASGEGVPTVTEYVADLAACGKYHFTTQEALTAVGEPVSKVRAALRRLKDEGEVVDPYRSFHVILPREHRGMRCPPAVDFVPQLMQHLEEPYYVALLSAAALYGAAEEHGVFQVMARLNRKPIDCDKWRVQFVGRKGLEQTPLHVMDTARGGLRVASPEATALELVGYADQCGGLQQVAEVVSHLVRELDPAKLVTAAAHGPIAWAQRLGYLLDMTDHRSVANVLAPMVQDLADDFAPLIRARPKAGAKRLPRWKLAVNAVV